MEIIEKDQDPKYVERLKKLLDSTKRWGKELVGYGLEVEIEEFMDAIGTLFMDYFQNHEEEAKFCSLGYDSTLATVYNKINDYYIPEKFDYLERIDPELNSWVFASRIKTNIEAYNSLFSHVTGKLDDIGFEEFLESRKSHPDLTWDEVPKNTPKTHWWWHV